LKAIEEPLKTAEMPEFKKIGYVEEWAGVRTRVYQYEIVEPRGCVVLVHGFGEYAGRYESGVVPNLLQAGWAVLTFDLVGHGHSGGKRGHCQGYGQLIGQVSAAYEKAGQLYPGQPRVLYGHSLGGNLVLNAVLRGAVSPSGVVASSPYLRLAFQPPAWKLAVGKILLRLAPSVTLPAGLDPSGISSQPEEVAAYKEDPLIHDRVSPNYSLPVIAAGEWVLEHASDWNIPLLIAHGGDDPIIDPEGSRILNRRVPGSKLLVLNGNRHELHHDRGRTAFFQAVSDWLEALAVPPQ